MNYLGPAIERNFSRWPLLGIYVWPNYYVFDTYEEEIDYLKSWTAERLVWMDEQILLTVNGQPVPAGFSLEYPYPNPFNPNTTIEFNLPKDSWVNLTIYDVMGRKIKTLVNSDKVSGNYSATWYATNDDGEIVSTGVYSYRLRVGDNSVTGSLVFLK